MQRKAFKMYLLPGHSVEYKKRHDEIWPELVELLHQAGIQNYSIFFDESTRTLFAYLEALDLAALESLSAQELMKKWWAYMADIMETNTDHSPVSIDLTPVFYVA
ncbi:MAG: L-rhamnose mutarotase [Cytophagales bacterium]|nr:L-rhamnose mutarotase [Cytophagales bacterium]